ncbi:MAG TPA: helix-turn-helix transcriptional regulator [Candidatus Eisenbacteria bacterium]|nr:helix-turn-helix transcriptional regulator [Candidatus Eisenbacteria bacterium]
MSTPSQRIRAARERTGLQIGEVAYRCGLSYEHYNDIESYDDDAAQTISLEALRRLSRSLGVTALFILEGADAATPTARITFAEFAACVAEAVRSSGKDVETWGEEAGWDVAPLLDDPGEIWGLNGEALREIAEAAGVDWRAVLPD